MESSMELEEILLEFRAGRMFIEGTRVVPDTRKGLVRLGRNEGGLLHFQWLDRIQNIVEEDQIVFPEEGIFEKVTQSSERVYLLKFISDDRKLFFWMQEPKSDRDLQICNLVNFYLCQPLTFIGEDEAEASIPFQISEMSRDATDDDISSRAGNLFDHGMASELAGEVTSAAGPVKLEDLQRIIKSIQQTAAVEDLDGGLGLGDILKPDLVLPLIETLPLEQRLASYLPEGSWTPEAVMELLQSAPFRQQVDTFTQVIRTGQIDLSQFGIIDASKYKFTVISFLEALDDSVRLTMEVRGTDESQRCSGSGSDPMDEK